MLANVKQSIGGTYYAIKQAKYAGARAMIDVAYEVARDLLNTYVADCSAELGNEDAKPKPDMKRIEKIDAMRLAILNEREDLNITDDSAMEAVIAKYRRTTDAGADPRSVAASFATELAS